MLPVSGYGDKAKPSQVRSIVRRLLGCGIWGDGTIVLYSTSTALFSFLLLRGLNV